MSRELLVAPNPILAQRCQPVRVFDDALRELAADMAQIMYSARGAGLSAPQVGDAVRLCIADVGGRFYALVNPRITHAERLQPSTEGCLSLPGVHLTVMRATKITVQAQALDGHRFKLKASGYLARVLQHETDHLDGITIADRARAAA